MDITAARYLEYWIHEFYDGLITLSASTSLSDDELETIYARGYNYFTYGKYEAARKIFGTLTASAPDTAHYWRALGAVNQQLAIYPEAIAAYDMALANDERDIISLIYRAESQILLGSLNDGLEDLKQAVELGLSSAEFKPWLRRAELLLEIHSSKISKLLRFLKDKYEILTGD